MNDRERIDVAISGGGHRASVWGLGVLMYLADARQTDADLEVRTMASVSGGSLTNAFVALGSPFNQAPDFRAAAGGFARRMAGSVGSFWAALVLMLGLVIATGIATWAGLGDEVTAWWPVVPIILTLLAAFGLGPRSGGSFWAWWGSWVYVAAVAWLILGLIAVWWVDVDMVVRVLAFAVGLAATAWLISRRNLISDHSFRATVCRKDNAVAPLTAMNTEPQHVICATELHGPHHIYMSQAFTWNWDFGIGQPNAMKVATAVQASSNLPGAFPIRWIPTADQEFVLSDPTADADSQTHLALTDGGVYDNMGEQWADGLGNRLKTIVRTRLGPQALAVEELTTSGGAVKVARTDWERMAISGPECGIDPIPIGAVDEDGSIRLPAVAMSGVITAGKIVRIDHRDANNVVVVDDYAAMMKSVRSIFPQDARVSAHLIMANASAGRALAKLKRSRVPVLGELSGLMSVVSALYDNGTAIRRRDLVGRWRRRGVIDELAEEHDFKVGWPFTEGADNGQIIQIDRSPWRIPRFFEEGADPDRAARAAAAIAYLGTLEETEGQWQCIAAENAEVATTFKPLGVEVTARLLYHAYVLSIVDLHVLLGHPLLSDSALNSVDAFKRLIETS